MPATGRPSCSGDEDLTRARGRGRNQVDCPTRATAGNRLVRLTAWRCRRILWRHFTPDMQIKVSGVVAVNIAASNIRMGTVVTLRLSSEIGGDTLENCNPLVGANVASTTATCTATFPFSVTITSARATW